MEYHWTTYSIDIMPYVKIVDKPQGNMVKEISYIETNISWLYLSIDAEIVGPT